MFGRNLDSEEVPMRKVVASEIVSLDGVVESPDKWHFPYFNDQMGDAIGAAMAASDAMLMGRMLYEEWAAFWPKQDPDENPVAPRMNGVRKYVVSTTLEDPLDELRLMVHPIVVGSGKRLFEEGGDQKALELLDSETFSTGVVYLTYQPAQS